MPLRLQVLVGLLQVRDLDADVRAADVGVRPVEGLLPLVVVAEEFEDAGPEPEEGEAQVHVGDADGPWPAPDRCPRR